MSKHAHQNPLWKRGQSGVADTVDVTSDPERDIGLSTVTEIQAAIDIVEDTQRSLGHVIVSNDPGISGTVSVEQIEALSIDDSTPVSVALAEAGTLDVAQTAPVELAADTELAVTADAANPLSVSQIEALSIDDSVPISVALADAGTLDVAQTAPVTLGDSYTSEIGKARLMDSGGTLVDPASEESVTALAEDVTEAGSHDLVASDFATTVTAPARAEAITVLVDAAAAADVYVGFGDGAGNYVERPAYTTDGSTQVFERVSVAATDVRVRAVDTSGAGSNEIDYRLMVI